METLTVPTLHRRCPRHHVVFTPPARCQACVSAESRARDARRGTTTERGLGWSYQRQRERILARDRGVCWLCGRPGADTVDHVVARARGGANDERNLRAAHAACNARRGAGK